VSGTALPSRIPSDKHKAVLLVQQHAPAVPSGHCPHACCFLRLQQHRRHKVGATSTFSG
jgi:hypothetical protein